MEAKKNFYDVLGVSKNATQDDIKSAYKKLSLKYHPDRPQNQADPSSKKKFSEISEAYQVLSDPQQRRSYDFTGQSGGFADGGAGGGFEGFDFGGGFGGGFGDFGNAEDIFSSFFGGGRRKQPTNRVQGEDIILSISISLEDVFNGKQVNVEYYRMERCEICSGSGIKEGAKQKCGTCHGTGYVSINAILTVIRQTCPDCQGTKFVSKTPCPGCGGKKRKKQKTSERINIPCGIEDGQAINIHNRGDAGIGAPNGNLIVTIRIKEHPIFKRDKGDLYITKHVPLSVMVLGGDVNVLSIVGPEFPITVQEGSQVNTRIRASDKGMRYQNSESRGNLYVDLVPIVPNPASMSKEVLEAWTLIYRAELNRSPPEPKKKFGFF